MSESLELSDPQAVFVEDFYRSRFAAFVGGFGSGKTWAGCVDNCRFLMEHPKTVTGYFGPTHPLIKDIYFATIEEAAHYFDMKCKVKLADKEVHFYRGRSYYGATLCRSMENPNNLIGFKIARAHIDEIDTMPIDKAGNAWRKIMARLRLKVDGEPNCARVTTTPEGFRFVHSKFAVDPKPGYRMVQASTYENAEYLPDGYIDSLLNDYPAQLIEAYLNGEFVNLTSGTVYNAYDRQANGSREAIRLNEPLYIGMDFNVADMSAAVAVKRENGLHVVGQLISVYDTPTMIETLKDKWPGHKIAVYPDASGGSRKTVNASTSDIALLRRAGFRVVVDASNPAVRDRIVSVNAGFQHGKLWVNEQSAPDVAKCLEQQAYGKNGEPDKEAGFDHMNDALGYLAVKEMPVRKPVSRAKIIGL